MDYFLRPWMRYWSYQGDFFLQKPDLLIALFRRLGWDKDKLYSWMRNYGIHPDRVEELLTLSELRFPSDVVAPAWLRDKKKWGKYWDDVKQLGIDDDRIELLKEMAYQLPTAQQAILWMAREVFEEGMASKYGLDDEADKIDYKFMETIGIKEEVARKHWRAHWQHASWPQILEMLHRRVTMADGTTFSEQDVKDWFRLVEIPPYWREGLIETMYALPGRIEVRMMAQYGIVDKPKIMELLRKDGLAEAYIEDVADMNIVRGVRSDIQTMYTKGLLYSEGVKA